MHNQTSEIFSPHRQLRTPRAIGRGEVTKLSRKWIWPCGSALNHSIAANHIRMSHLLARLAPHGRKSRCFVSHLSNNRTVLWLTPLFSVDYTRSIAREVAAHLSVDHSSGNSRPGPAEVEWHKGRRDTRGRLGHNEPLESVGRVSLQARRGQWTCQDIAWCGTHGSPEILFPLEQSGQVMYWGAGSTFTLNVYPEPFKRRASSEAWSPPEHCSAECRTRCHQSSQRAASA